MAKSFEGQSNILQWIDIFIAASHDLVVPLNPVSVIVGRDCAAG